MPRTQLRIRARRQLPAGAPVRACAALAPLPGLAIAAWAFTPAAG